MVSLRICTSNNRVACPQEASIISHLQRSCCPLEVIQLLFVCMYVCDIVWYVCVHVHIIVCLPLPSNQSFFRLLPGTGRVEVTMRYSGGERGPCNSCIVIRQWETYYVCMCVCNG